MGKIKISLVSGAIQEKPLINAFKANNISYVILDNEINGSMGLPIILVCKYENNKLFKIEDQNEWQNVKEYLKNIIAGSPSEFINVPSEMTADDIYYTQLTLPVPSFDALKNAYKPSESDGAQANSNNNSTIGNINPNEQVGQVANEPVINSVPPIQEPTIPVPNTTVTDTSIPTPSVSTVNETQTPVIDLNTPVPSFGVPNSNVSSDIRTSEINPTTPVVDVNVTNIVPPTSTTYETPVVNNNQSSEDLGSVFREQKEAFMQACENMFEALVQKFEKELENRK